MDMPSSSSSNTDLEISSLDALGAMEVLNCSLKQSRERKHNALSSLFNEDNDSLSSSNTFWDIDDYNEEEESESADECSLFDVQPRNPHEKTLQSTEPYQHFIYYFLLHATDSDFNFLLMLYYDTFSFSPEKFKFGAYSKGSFLYFDGFRTRISFLEGVKTIQESILWNTHYLNSFCRIGRAVQTECLLCYMPRMLNLRYCCDYAVCNECIAKHICVQLENGSNVICPGCSTLMHSSEVLLRLEYSLHRNMFKIYTERLKDLALSSTQYKCPNCSNVLYALTKTAKNKRGKELENTCSNCGFVSCPACKSPRHERLSCKQYQKGEKSMKIWAERKQGPKTRTRNATKCPKCKRWYQKTDGCDHMNCMKCGTEFCYSCGGKYRDVYLLGSHKSRFSVLGCQNNLLPNHSVLRKTIRGSLVVGAVAVTPVVVPAVLVVRATKNVAHKISRHFYF